MQTHFNVQTQGWSVGLAPHRARRGSPYLTRKISKRMQQLWCMRWGCIAATINRITLLPSYVYSSYTCYAIADMHVIGENWWQTVFARFQLLTIVDIVSILKTADTMARDVPNKSWAIAWNPETEANINQIRFASNQCIPMRSWTRWNYQAATRGRDSKHPSRASGNMPRNYSAEAAQRCAKVPRKFKNWYQVHAMSYYVKDAN